MSGFESLYLRQIRYLSSGYFIAKGVFVMPTCRVFHWGSYTFLLMIFDYEIRVALLGVNDNQLTACVQPEGHCFYTLPGLPLYLEKETLGLFVNTRHFIVKSPNHYVFVIGSEFAELKEDGAIMFKKDRRSATTLSKLVANTPWLQFHSGDAVSGARILGYLAMDPYADVRGIKKGRVITHNDYLVYLDPQGYYAFTEIPA